MILEASHISWFKCLIKSMDYADNNHDSSEPSHGHTMLGAISKVWFVINLK